MAITKCPACKQRVSDKAKTCNHCNFNFVKGETASGETEEQLASKQKLKRIKQRYSLQMQAMSGIILFLAGIATWYLVGNSQLTDISHFIELSVAGIGAVWYLVTRIRLLAFKKQR
ncbi:hypothetical protein [Aliikangiella sp. IMCC44632]